MTVRTKYTRRGSMRELTVTLAHLLQDSEKPPLSEGLRQLTDLCSKNKMQIIAGCDANAHHIIQVSMDINQRGECLMEYLVCTILNILNKGMKHSLVVSKTKEVIHLRIATHKTGNLVTKWHVFDKIPLSDHRYILFQTTRVTYCNPKRTTWEPYWIDVKANLRSY